MFEELAQTCRRFEQGVQCFSQAQIAREDKLCTAVLQGRTAQDAQDDRDYMLDGRRQKSELN